MKQHRYDSYEQYRDSQIAVNKKKLGRWPTCHQANRKTLEKLAGYVLGNLESPYCGLCHGARNGWEVNVLYDLLPGSYIIGTDISPTASDFEHMFQHDFQEANAEWIGRFDFVYCNCLDHAMDAVLAINTWLQQLSDRGVLFVEWTPFHGGGVNDPNCFSAEKNEYEEFLDTVGTVIDVLEFEVINTDQACTMPKNKPYEVALFVVRPL